MTIIRDDSGWIVVDPLMRAWWIAASAKGLPKARRPLWSRVIKLKKSGDPIQTDGVSIILQKASGSEAEDEFTFYVAEHKVQCMAEVCTQTSHKITTPRSAQARNAVLRSCAIDEALILFADEAD